MKTSFILIISFVAVCTALFFTACNNETVGSSPPKIVSVSAMIAEADNLYKERADPQKLQQGIELLRRAQMADGSNYEAAWKLSKFFYFLGDDAKKSKKERQEAFKNGIEAARLAVNLEPEKPDGRFWLGANLGGEAQLSLLSGAANVREIRQNMKKVIELQPSYQNASAYVALAQIELKTRNFLGGSSEKAIEYSETALEIEKNNAFVYLALAESYLAAKRKTEARQVLETLINKPPHPDYVPEHAKVVTQAKQLLAKKFDN